MFKRVFLLIAIAFMVCGCTDKANVAKGKKWNEIMDGSSYTKVGEGFSVSELGLPRD